MEKRFREMEILQRGGAVPAPDLGGPILDADDVDDLEEAPENEVEVAEEEILDQATAAATLAELKHEIATLGRLEALAAEVRRSGQDTKWRELAHLLGEIFTPTGLVGRIGELDQGTARNGQPSTGEPYGRFRYWDLDAFAQDSWKLKSNVTLE